MGSLPFRADEMIIGLPAEMGHRRDADASARLLSDGSSLVVRWRYSASRCRQPGRLAVAPTCSRLARIFMHNSRGTRTPAHAAMRDVRTGTGHGACPPRSGSCQPGSSLAAAGRFDAAHASRIRLPTRAAVRIRGCGSASPGSAGRLTAHLRLPMNLASPWSSALVDNCQAPAADGSPRRGTQVPERLRCR